MFFELAVWAFYLALFVMLTGFVVTLIAWVTDNEKVEKIGIRISMLGVILAVLSASSCTAGLFTRW